MKKTYNLRFRIAIPICLVFVFGFLIQGYLSTSFLYKAHLDALRVEHFNRVSSYATSIDQKLQSAQKSLISVAEVLPVPDINDPDKLQSWLDDRRALLSTFDNSLFVFSSGGDLLVESPFKPNRRGRNYSFREYFQETIKSRKPFISDPYISSQRHNHPAIMMTVPVFDGAGRIIAVFGGGLDLLGENFLGRLSQQKIGVDGYFYLAGSDRTLIVHPDSRRIMQKDVPVGSNPLFDRAMNGFEGCEENTNSKGLFALTAFKQLQAKQWVLAGNYPMQEIAEPLTHARHIIWVAFAGTFLLMFLLILSSFKQVFDPLQRFTQHLSDISLKKGEERLFQYPSPGELAILADRFNQMIQDLDKTHQSLDQAQQMAHLGSWTWDMQTDRLSWSDEVFRIMGDEPGDYHPTLEVFLEKIHPDDRSKVEEAIDLSLMTFKPYSIDHRIETKDGRVRFVKEQGEVQVDSSGEPFGMIGTVQDISDVIQLQDKLKTLATTDELTGTANRREFLAQAEILYLRASRYKNPFSMIFYDLDHFKTVNDQFGHPAGDKALQKVTLAVQAMIRDTDILARYGGEEFCILLPETRQGNAAILAERIRRSVEELTIELATGETLKLTISLGVAEYTETDTISALIERADRAVYQAKKAGRNCAVVI